MAWRLEGWKNPHLYFGSPHTEFDLIANGKHEAFEAGADAMLEAITEEIEKVENPYFLKDIDGGYYNKYPEFEVFEDCRQKILSLLRK